MQTQTQIQQKGLTMKNTLNKITVSIVAVSALSTQLYSFSLFGSSIDEATLPAQIDQLVVMRKQLKSIASQCKAACGVKDATKLYGDLKQFVEVMDKFKVTLEDLDIKNPKSQIGVLAQQILQRNKVFDNCKSKCLSDLQKEVCENNQIRNVQALATTMLYSKELTKISNRLQDLSKKLAASKELKESQDIGNAINLELANLQLTKTNIEMMKQMLEEKKRADQDRLKQERSKNIGKLPDTSNW